jgi:predicted molibdopterin-dependent oxidoreductase YjgC
MLDPPDEPSGHGRAEPRLRGFSRGLQRQRIDAGDRLSDIGTKRLYADGKFSTKDGKATFMETKWRGLQAEGKEAEMKKWPFLINNGRTNITWQSSYLDQDNVARRSSK